LLGLVVGAGLLIGAVPAWRAYRNSLADGLTIRV
jgi:putative ABC transport system permease protein